MARTDRCTVFREGSLKLHPQGLKSGSNGRFRESFKLHVCEMGRPVCRTRFRTFKEEHEVEDDEFSDTLRKEELLDHDNCMWLSSGGASSPSSCFQDNLMPGYMDPKIDAWFISLLSTPSRSNSPVLSTEITFFDGSRVNPIEEAYSVLDQRTIADEDEDVVFQEKLEEEEVVSWLVTSVENENESPDTFSATCSNGDAELYYGQSSVKDFTDFHKFCFLSKRSLDKRPESELAHFQSDFSSPVNKSYSVSSVTDSSEEHSLFSSSSSSDYSSEVVDLEEIGTGDPLFWPSDSASDWSSETTWDFFIMSPRKDIYKVGSSQKTSPYALNLRVPKGEPHLEKSSNRRLVFDTHSKRSDRFHLKNINDINDIDKKKRMPSRLRKSTKTSTKIVPLHNDADFGALTETKYFNDIKFMDTFSATSTSGPESTCDNSFSEIFTNSNQTSDETSTPSYTRSVSVTPVSKTLQLSASSYDHATEIAAPSFEETRFKTPVFWPSSCATKWNSDTKWDFFIMSPPKYFYRDSKSPKTSPDTPRLQLLIGNKELDKSCSRRLEFSSSSKSSTNIKEGPTNESMASKLKSTKTVSIFDEDDTTRPPEVEVLTRESVSKHKILLEDLLLVDKLNVEGAIEDVLGLGEFDGHEGVESGFNKNDFSFVEIL